MSTKNEYIGALAYLEKKFGRLTFGKMLQTIRLCEEETQEVFSEKLGISRHQLSDIENDRKSVSPKAAAKYAKLLGYSEERFIKLALQDTLERSGLRYDVEVTPAKKRKALEERMQDL